MAKAAWGVAVLLIAGWWIATEPPAYIEIAPPYESLQDAAPAAVLAADAGDYVLANLRTQPSELPGYDEVVLREDQNAAYVTAMDGWIWKVDLASGQAERFADPPLMPAGARLDPTDPDRLYVCAARLYGARYDEEERPGVYWLDVSATPTTGVRPVHPVALRVPLPPPRAAQAGAEGMLFAPGTTPTVAIDDANPAASRDIAFCNDLDVSRDGRRIYFTEPFAYENASMGAGAFREAIALGRNGRLWQLDLDRGTVSLVAQNYTFIDGVLLEHGAAADAREKSVLVTETVKFRILRFYLDGERATRDEILWESLPGLPDGIDRDAQGRIWVGLVKTRSKVGTWVHKHPWIKPLLLRLPHALLPVPKQTGLIALSPDASRVLFYSVHDGSRVADISVVTPGKDALYPANFDLAQRGFHRLPYPKEQ